MSMADMENKGGRRQHHQGSIQNTNGMSMICALGQGLVIFVIDAGMIDTVDIAETKVEGFALQWFTVQYCLSHTDIDTQTKWYQNTDMSPLIRAEPLGVSQLWAQSQGIGLLISLTIYAQYSSV
ncbi:LOW QUALITY PROTEIN: hypothetical protein FGSG_11907 [Fusarium graminearum PH-1]|uniref:hypothetical protein n=1 Tax=Gibberella zeae (strain ATCC MYA-4620 / CBS 123657 / FGSC 9075 / NRRL 31084 / PH-1) TaxID=229533 RepID=UPI00021F14B6|nr:LOW QUALITY PROTEIN: hypothetical protein FGSG_11907 [Fusarium graminearum PH-1]ESU06446.1 LOW QUALITY PROTEIN: hypothetical protein FGSG_11907 [Fusarium graminearum PH-1]|eukprot:XP_011316931.1 LOW QUALITY PROTEIN: hypothetical protein FGSG_11907 [Fusarium graminearum PH-1]